MIPNKYYLYEVSNAVGKQLINNTDSSSIVYQTILSLHRSLNFPSSSNLQAILSTNGNRFIFFKLEITYQVLKY